MIDVVVSLFYNNNNNNDIGTSGIDTYAFSVALSLAFSIQRLQMFFSLISDL